MTHSSRLVLRFLEPGDAVTVVGILFQHRSRYGLLLDSERYEYPVEVPLPSAISVPIMGPGVGAGSSWLKCLGALVTVRGQWDGESVLVEEDQPLDLSFDWSDSERSVSSDRSVLDHQTSRLGEPLQMAPGAGVLFERGDLLELSTDADTPFVYATSTNKPAVEAALRPVYRDRLVVVESALSAMEAQRLKSIVYSLPGHLLSSFGQQASASHQLQLNATIKWVPKSLAMELAAFPPGHVDLRVLIAAD